MNDRILEALENARGYVSLRALAEQLDAGEVALREGLEALIAQGRVVAAKKGRYALTEIAGLVAARIGFQRNGTPLAHPVAGGDGMPVHYGGAERCMTDDLVLVRPEGDRCALYSILRRGRDRLPGYMRIERRRRAEDEPLASAVPCDVRLPYGIRLVGDLSIARNDEIALLKIERYPEANRPIEASILRTLGDSGSLRALMCAVAEDHGFATAPLDEVKAEADAMPGGVTAKDLSDREDLRALTAFTIDGATAKDFDDAVSIERLADGWRLGVHIADVSHYVAHGSAIDADAALRGTSLYLPGLTVPMLPERLSNDLCSLMPGVDRLALSLFMDVQGGDVVDHRLVKSVIHSRARLTYQAVNRLFEGGETDIAPEIAAALDEMRALSRVLREKRAARGAVDFDMDEPEFILDATGEPADVLCEPRGEAERIIEDFMLAANGTVAALARNTELPFIYRVHESPDADRLRALENFLNGVNLRVRLGANPHPRRLREVLSEAEEHPARDVVRHHLLRAMKRARYSESPEGHYALALKDYCHFTSPIRRYPDLIVHRMLKLLIDGDLSRAGRMDARMPALAADCSARENAATLAERQGDGIMMAAYLSGRIGEEFDGVVSGVTGWGLYVTLPFQAEGLVHIAGLDDYYVYDAERCRLVAPATDIAFSLGDRVRVRVEGVSVAAGEIDFALCAPPEK